MPSVLRQSGPKWIKDGETVTPRALVSFCDVCGWEGAPFGSLSTDGKRLYFCGWNGQPMCMRKGNGTGQQGDQHG